MPGELKKELLSRRTLVNALVFALPVSALVEWRISVSTGMPLFSLDAFTGFLFMAVVCGGLYLGVIALLYWLSTRAQQRD